MSEQRRILAFVTYVLVLAASLPLSVPTMLSGQIVGATITGTVTDTASGVVPSVHMSIMCVQLIDFLR
jgi:hypothetical protein